MCGIFGYLGQDEAAPILLDALRRMEYRGYDSAGIATLCDGRLQRRRAAGKLTSLANLLVRDPILGRVGIGHTRWATHGQASVTNAHPHQSSHVAVAHNGIIENFREIRVELARHGITHDSETDTESAAHLCQYLLNQGMTPLEAARNTVQRLEGSFALTFLFEGEENLLIAARRYSPLVVGHGKNEMFLASDVIALAGLTRTVTFLDDGDLAVMSRSGLEVYDSTGERTARDQTQISIDSTPAGKGSHQHFMAKEIHEQPRMLAAAIEKLGENSELLVPDSTVQAVADSTQIELIGCGTASYACQIAEYWFENLAGLPTSSGVASEFVHRHRRLEKDALGIFVSQSGETADTLNALRHMRERGGRTLAVLNVTTSTMSREADLVMPIHAGTEISVASTKAFTCQLIALVTLAISVGYKRGGIGKEDYEYLVGELGRLPGLSSAALSSDAEARSAAQEISQSASVLFIGRGTMFPLALEGALKLKEISYIHAEGLAAGELKHGALALVDSNMHVVALAPGGTHFAKTISNTEEIKARGGQVLLLSDAQGLEAAPTGGWKTMTMPAIDPLFAPIIYAIPLQLLAYHAAVHLGTDVDHPRNLAKSVTVE